MFIVIQLAYNDEKKCNEWKPLSDRTFRKLHRAAQYAIANGHLERFVQPVEVVDRHWFIPPPIPEFAKPAL